MPQAGVGDAKPSKMWWGSEVYQPTETAFILPAALITAGVVVTAWGDGTNDFGLLRRKGWKAPNNPLASQYADIAEYGMFGWVFLCDLMAREKHHFQEQIMVSILAEMINGGILYGIKYSVNLPRPDGGNQSFPSGHTANAFLGAHLAFKEFGKSAPALVCMGYVMATAVAASRVYCHKHWIADVAAGAGIGMLSVELAYLLYFPGERTLPTPRKKRDKGKLRAMPVLMAGGAGLHINCAF
jgi:membrane-associated phospholipid phosphatase